MMRILAVLLFLCIILSACGKTLAPSQSANVPSEPMVTAPANMKVQTSVTTGADGLISMNISWEPTD